jgi:hypothetical protein
MKTSDNSDGSIIVEVEDAIGETIDRRSSQLPMNPRKLLWIPRDPLQRSVEGFCE